jgi:hypothetical protein
LHPWIYYALEVSGDRERNARDHRLALEVRRHELTHAGRTSRIRRSTAVALAALTRGSADVVRRLDDCVADDLQHALAPSE